MNTENLLNEQRILGLEKKLLAAAEALALSRQENEAFIHLAAHDLQAPLRKISTFADRAMEKYLAGKPEEAAVHMEKMLANISAMQSLVNGLGALSAAASVSLHFTDCDGGTLLAAALQENSAAIAEKNIAVHAGALPLLQADPMQLKQLFDELLSNAIKFSRAEGGAITISAALMRPEENALAGLPVDKKYHRIEFADNGIGFSAESEAKIFKPFFRLHGRSAYEGHGLGLATCKKIVERHSGTMYARGMEIEGARFIVILPETQDTLHAIAE